MDIALKRTKILVILVESKQKIIIPLKWIQIERNDMSWIINWGIKRGLDRKIFFSANEDDEADFNLAMKTEFSNMASACYIARIIKSCGMYITF